MSSEKRIVVLDIGGTKIASALVVLSDTTLPCIKAYGKIPTEATRGGEFVLSRAIDSVQRVFNECEGCIDGIGVSSAGVIDPFTGDVTYANDLMPGWGGTHLGSALEEEFGVRVSVLNDVHAHALGEARWGAGRGKDSCLVVAIGTGIGGAFVDNGRILLGEHHEAGHVGHLACYHAHGIPCSCGASSHLEPIAAGPGIIEGYLEHGGSKSTHDGSILDGAYIDKLARQGDPAAIFAEERSGSAIGEVLASVANMLDPTCIILSGSVAQCGPAWHKAMDIGWNETVMPPVAQTPRILGELADDAPLIGAAEHVIRSAYGR